MGKQTLMYKSRSSRTKRNGFTLIEVVLVLAIGGLIFLLAFLAFSQVSRNRRDTQRRSDVRRMVAAVQNFVSDNNMQYPCSDISTAWVCHGGSPLWNDLVTNYLNSSNMKDPSSGSNYSYQAYNGVATNFNISHYFRTTTILTPGYVVYGAHASCVNGDLTASSAMPKSAYGFWIVTEGSTGTCVDSR